MTISDFFCVLFDENEHTCFSKDQLGTSVYDVDSRCEQVSSWATLFSINPLHPCNDLKPTEAYHSKDRPRRADVNVVAYRNILIEMDFIPVDEQQAFIEGMGVPYTTAVFSGNKSVHYIISLVNAVPDEKAYRGLVERVHKALGGKEVVDVACKNPSRFSRFPEAYRPDKGTVQTLISVGERIPNETLESWLLSKGVTSEKLITRNNVPKAYTNTVNTKHVNGFTLNFIMCGAPEGQRNTSLFKAACDYCRCGYSEEDAIKILTGPSGLELPEVLRTIKSAYLRVSFEN